MPKKMPKMKKFPVCVEADLHTEFKVMCAVRGVRMTDVVRELLRREIEAARKAKVASRLDEIAA
jgi:hypothetical protein